MFFSLTALVAVAAGNAVGAAFNPSAAGAKAVSAALARPACLLLVETETAVMKILEKPVEAQNEAFPCYSTSTKANLKLFLELLRDHQKSSQYKNHRTPLLETSLEKWPHGICTVRTSAPEVVPENPL